MNAQLSHASLYQKTRNCFLNVSNVHFNHWAYYRHDSMLHSDCIWTLLKKILFLMCFERACQFKLKMWIFTASKSCSHLTSRRKWKLPKYTIAEVHLHKENNKIWLDAKQKPPNTAWCNFPAPLTVKLFQKLNTKEFSHKIHITIHNEKNLETGVRFWALFVILK